MANSEFSKKLRTRCAKTPALFTLLWGAPPHRKKKLNLSDYYLYKLVMLLLRRPQGRCEHTWQAVVYKQHQSEFPWHRRRRHSEKKRLRGKRRRRHWAVKTVPDLPEPLRFCVLLQKHPTELLYWNNIIFITLVVAFLFLPLPPGVASPAAGLRLHQPSAQLTVRNIVSEATAGGQCVTISFPLLSAELPGLLLRWMVISIAIKLCVKDDHRIIIVRRRWQKRRVDGGRADKKETIKFPDSADLERCSTRSRRDGIADDRSPANQGQGGPPLKKKGQMVEK